MEQLTLFVADSPAKTSASQEREQDLKAKDQDSGGSSTVSSKKSNRSTQSSKTSQPFDLEDWIKFSGRSLRSATMQNGIVSPLPPLVRLTEGTESGLWRTPETVQGGTVSQEVLEEMAKGNWKRESGHQRQLRLQDQVRHPKLYPTPRANSAMATTLTPKVASHPHKNLEVAIAREMFPTPTTHSAKEMGYPAEYRRKTPGLGSVVKLYPTPQASDHRDRGNLSNPSVQRRLSIGKQLSLSMVVSPKSGQLNPTWVEWLMGFPIGWTDLNS